MNYTYTIYVVDKNYNGYWEINSTYKTDITIFIHEELTDKDIIRLLIAENIFTNAALNSVSLDYSCSRDYIEFYEGDRPIGRLDLVR